MRVLYSHRQFGRTVFALGIIVGVVVGAIVPTIALSSAADRGAAFWLSSLVPGVIACAALLLFAWMRVSVTESRVEWAFGAGFPSFSLDLADVTDAHVVRTALVYGYGIHRTLKGWLYNVGGRQAVAVTTPARTVIIGTDDPEGLLGAINAARAGRSTAA